jgi:hypothetical protein
MSHSSGGVAVIDAYCSLTELLQLRFGASGMTFVLCMPISMLSREMAPFSTVEYAAKSSLKAATGYYSVSICNTSGLSFACSKAHTLAVK